jgi:hypothetical protein
MTLVLPTTLLLLSAWCAGGLVLWLAGKGGSGDGSADDGRLGAPALADARPGAATSTLLGLLTLAAVLPNLFQLGLPRGAVLAVGYGLAAAGLVAHLRFGSRPRPGPILVALGLAALASSALFVSSTAPPLRFDAIATWWPKVLEVARGEPALLETAADAVHVHPEYPRGLAWLASVASPGGAPDARWLRLCTWLFGWLVACSLVEWARGLGRPRAGLLAAGVFLLISDVAVWSSSGYLDLALAGAVLLCSVGLALRERDAAAGTAMAVLAAAGGASLKQEGAVLILVVAAACLLDLRHGSRRRVALSGLAGFVVVLPWWLARTDAPGEVLSSAQQVLSSPWLLLARLTAVGRELVGYLMDPVVLKEAAGKVKLNDADVPMAMAFRALVVSGLVLLPRGRRCLTLAPAAAMLAAILVVFVITPHPLQWHLYTAFPRLSLQILPVLLLAAVWRLSEPVELAGEASAGAPRS